MLRACMREGMPSRPGPGPGKVLAALFRGYLRAWGCASRDLGPVRCNCAPHSHFQLACCGAAVAFCSRHVTLARSPSLSPYLWHFYSSVVRDWAAPVCRRPHHVPSLSILTPSPPLHPLDSAPLHSTTLHYTATTPHSDNLDVKSDILDWHGDHLHTNYHGLTDFLRDKGEPGPGLIRHALEDAGCRSFYASGLGHLSP